MCGTVAMANSSYAVRYSCSSYGKDPSPLVSPHRALPVPSEIDTLPVFPREQLRLQRLLGSGAFGEVYEGIASGMASEELKSDTRVAVKVLFTFCHFLNNYIHLTILSYKGAVTMPTLKRLKKNAFKASVLG